MAKTQFPSVFDPVHCKQEDNDLKLPPIVENKAIVKTVNRLYPGRRAAADDSLPVATDEEFRGWLQLPRRMAGHTVGSASSPITNTMRGRGALRMAATLMTQSKDKQDKSEQGSWNLVLLRKTFDDGCKSPADVADAITKVLGMDSDEARKRVQEARSCALVVLETDDSSPKTFAKAEALREYGLVVQVVTDSGLPTQGASCSPRRSSRRTYEDVFEQSVRGSDRIKRGRGGQQRHPSAGPTRRSSVADHEDGKTSPRENGPKTPRPRVSIASGKDSPDPAKEPGSLPEQPSTEQAVDPSKKLGPLRRETCRMLRFFVYGAIGDEEYLTAQEKEEIFKEQIGTKEKAQMLYQMFQNIDEDGSGRVNIAEFRGFAEKTIMSRLSSDVPVVVGSPKFGTPAWASVRSPEESAKFVAKLCDKLGMALLEKKSSFCLEDLMKIIWPGAQVPQLKTMAKWCYDGDYTAAKVRVKTPPVLPKQDFDGLCSVFEYYDEDHSGMVSGDELLNKGLIYEDQMEALLKDWDQDGDGHLDVLEFCEMMCPLGFRAHEQAHTGSRSDGTRLIFDRALGCWRIDEKYEGTEGASASRRPQIDCVRNDCI